MAKATCASVRRGDMKRAPVRMMRAAQRGAIAFHSSEPVIAADVPLTVNRYLSFTQSLSRFYSSFPLHEVARGCADWLRCCATCATCATSLTEQGLLFSTIRRGGNCAVQTPRRMRTISQPSHSLSRRERPRAPESTAVRDAKRSRELMCGLHRRIDYPNGKAPRTRRAVPEVLK